VLVRVPLFFQGRCCRLLFLKVRLGEQDSIGFATLLGILVVVMRERHAG